MKDKIGPLSAFSALSQSQASRGAEIFSFLTADWNLLLKESFRTIIFATVSNWLYHHCILKKNLPSTIIIHLILLITMIIITITNIIILLLISGCTGSLLVVASHRICNAAFPPQLLLSSWLNISIEHWTLIEHLNWTSLHLDSCSSHLTWTSQLNFDN